MNHTKLFSDTSEFFLARVFVTALISLITTVAQAQNLRWVKQTPGGEAVAVDGSRNSYVTGWFNNTATFGLGESNETTLTDAGNGDIFVAKYDSTGALIWAIRAGGTGIDVGSDIAVDVSGYIYITGDFGASLSGTHSATFGLGEPNQTTLMSAGEYDMFVAKYDSNGMLVWAKRAGGAGWESGNGIAVDISGNSYITGRFGYSYDAGTEARATFGAGEANKTILTSAGGPDIFVAKYNADGTLA